MKIEIVSGEGEIGTAELFTGRQTARAVRRALSRERCGGDRWAFVVVDGERVDDSRTRYRLFGERRVHDQLRFALRLEADLSSEDWIRLGTPPQSRGCR